MAKSLSLRSGLGSVLFWSVISAAFIGPGSVTACAIAGSSYDLQLLWVLTFATFGTVWLQEAAARITIATGKDLGQVITQTYTGARGRWIAWGLFLAVFLGCAAYQAGNILGAVSGLALLTNLPIPTLTVAVGLLCIALLWIGSTQGLSNFLGLIVFAMGGAFVYVAFGAPVTGTALTKALLVPAFPTGSLLLINWLIGTTIVPYNLFFGSSIVPAGGASAQSLSEMRLGIWVAVTLGGIISVALLLAGLLIPNDFSYPHMAQVLTERLGWFFVCVWPVCGWFCVITNRPPGGSRNGAKFTGCYQEQSSLPHCLACSHAHRTGIWLIERNANSGNCSSSGYQWYSFALRHYLSVYCSQ